MTHIEKSTLDNALTGLFFMIHLVDRCNACGVMTSNITRTTPQLYRDCLRLVDHIAGRSAKGKSLRRIIGSEFRKHKNIKDAVIIEGLKSNAIRGLSNYLVMESSNKDLKLKSQAATFAETEASELAKFAPDKLER